MSAASADPLAVGRRFTKTVVTDLRRTQLVQYSGASGDFNPMHSDDVFARETVGLPGVFAHGMLTMAMSGSLVSDVFGIQHVVYFGGQFRAQVWPGDTLTAVLEVTEVEATDAGRTRVSATVRTVNQNGVEVFKASARALIDTPD